MSKVHKSKLTHEDSDYRRVFTQIICEDCKYADVPRNRKPCCACYWLARESYYEEAENE